MFPHERSLVKKLESKPFVLIGVNGDGNDPTLQQQNATHQITWRSFKNERIGKPEVAQVWGLQAWPTLVLIDHKGIVRNVWTGSPGNAALDQAIDEAVKAAEGG